MGVTFRPFEEAGEQLVQYAAAGAYTAALEIMDASLIQVPRDTETLADSHGISDPTPMRSNLGTFLPGFYVDFGYGYGFDVNPKTGLYARDYAAAVHEILEARHEPPTKAKFLEDPVYDYSSELEGQMALSMQEFDKNWTGRIRGWAEFAPRDPNGGM